MESLATLVDGLFEELGESPLLDVQSSFSEQARVRVERTCRHIFTLDDVLGDYNADWASSRQATMWLFAYTWFLDQALDNLNARRVRANQIAEHLLLRYSNWVCTTQAPPVYARFLLAHGKFSEYLHAEKKWSAPDEYVKRFGHVESVIAKASICLFPIECLALSGSTARKATLTELYAHYFTCLLLADDIQDVDDDIQNRTLTYPIAMHFQETATLPTSVTEVGPALRMTHQALVQSAAAVNAKCALLNLDSAVFSLDKLILPQTHVDSTEHTWRT